MRSFIKRELRFAHSVPVGDAANAPTSDDRESDASLCSAEIRDANAFNPITTLTAGKGPGTNPRRREAAVRRTSLEQIQTNRNKQLGRAKHCGRFGTVQSLLGHSSPAITRRTYIHSLPTGCERGGPEGGRFANSTQTNPNCGNPQNGVLANTMSSLDRMVGPRGRFSNSRGWLRNSGLSQGFNLAPRGGPGP
jgi:hypothetical protein